MAASTPLAGRLGRMLSADNYVQDPLSTQSFNRYSYVLNNPLSYNDPDGQFWNFVIGGVAGGISGWQIGKAQGARGWGMVGYIFGGAAIGVATAGVAQGVLSSFSAAAQAGASGTWASVGAYATSGAAAGAFSGASFAALSGQDIAPATLRGLVWGGLGGAFTGGLKAQSFQYRFARQLSDPDYWLAELRPKPRTYWGGILDEVRITPTSHLATGAVQPSYFFEELFIGGRLLEGGLLAGRYLWGGARMAAEGGIQITKHAAERMGERSITQKMVETGIAKGTKYLDPKNGTLNYVLKNGFASGKDLLIGVSPQTGKVTTVLRGNNLVNKRFIPQ